MKREQEREQERRKHQMVEARIKHEHGENAGGERGTPAAEPCAQQKVGGQKRPARSRNLGQSAAEEVPHRSERENCQRRRGGRHRKAKAGNGFHERETQERADEETSRVPVQLADARVAERQVQQPADPAIERLIVECLVAGLEPEAVHEDPIARHLVREPVVNRIGGKMANLRQRPRGEQCEPGNAEQHERAAQVAVRRGDRHDCGRNQQQAGQPLEMSDGARGREGRAGDDTPCNQQRAGTVSGHERHRPPREQRHDQRACRDRHRRREPPVAPRRLAHRQHRRSKGIVIVPARYELPAIAGQLSAKYDGVRASVQ